MSSFWRAGSQEPAVNAAMLGDDDLEEYEDEDDEFSLLLKVQAPALHRMMPAEARKRLAMGFLGLLALLLLWAVSVTLMYTSAARSLHNCEYHHRVDRTRYSITHHYLDS
jgi:hypothetical protein